ncbi:MFS transporter [Alicyclobacillus shizuokensis]|uniref:MFS transporter n=1 Tax=Alicyclobacillus shizuokensis TaxID=392014 RepID=UPI0008374E97|nr:MFS transporter [Alicyclobacillus shizuokensis]
MSAFTLLRNRYVQSVVVSNLFSQFGIWVRKFSILLFVTEKTHGNAVAVSLIFVAEYAPIFIFSFLGGTFADRWRRPKRTVIWADLLSMVSVYVVIVLMAAGAWQTVFGVTLCSSVLSQFAQPSGMKLFRLHVPREQAQSGMSLLQTLFSVYMILGPIFGTFVYERLGIDRALAVTGTAFLLSALAMLFIPPDGASDLGNQSARPSLKREMMDGIRYVWSRRVLLSSCMTFMIVGLGVGLVSPLSIFLVTQRLGLPASDLQWITIPYGAGEIIGGMATFAVARKVLPHHLLMLGLLADAMGIAASGMSTTLWMTMAAQWWTALFQPAILIGNNTLVMRNTEPDYIGRVTGIRTPLMTGSMVIMMGVSGVAKNVMPLTTLYALAGACFFVGFLITGCTVKSHDAGLAPKVKL